MFDLSKNYIIVSATALASGGSGGEGAPMVYADNVKDWNNLVLTKDFLDLLGEDPDDVRHALCRLPQ